MAFGLKYIQGAEKDRLQSLSARIKEDGAEEQRPAEQSPAAARPAPMRAASTPTAAPAKSAAVMDQELRTRRLVQEVGEFKKWSIDQITQAERRAQVDPDGVFKEFWPIYQDEIKPARQRCVRTLDDALKAHPGDVVYLLVKSGQNKLRVMPRSDAGSQVLLHGTVVESIPAAHTRFAPPSEWPAATDPAPPAGRASAATAAVVGTTVAVAAAETAVAAAEDAAHAASAPPSASRAANRFSRAAP